MPGLCGICCKAHCICDTLNFTGTSPFTSRSGVRREIFAYVPAMAWMLGIGIALNVASIFLRGALHLPGAMHLNAPEETGSGILFNSYRTNTLRYEAERCNGCGMCAAVCPHGVFAVEDRHASLARPEACMECGACQLNCPTGAVAVESGVGCAAAMIQAALTLVVPHP